jgi:two-component system LytT family response regulator
MYLTDGEGHARRVSGGGWAVPPEGTPTQAAPLARPLRSILVDPDALARRHLRQLLELESDVVVSAECEAGAEALDVAARDRPELVFLDVVLPDMDGFALAHELRPHIGGGVIFVTDRPQGALGAFEVHALDYMLKPVGADRLHLALLHAHAELRSRRDSGVSERLIALLDRRDAERQRRARLLIRHADGAFFLKTEAIDWVEAAGKLVKVHTGKQVHVQREALARIERHLDPDQFIRISRSAIVNVDQIREIQPWFNGEYLVILDDGSQVPTSRHYRNNLRRLFGKGDEP